MFFESWRWIVGFGIVGALVSIFYALTSPPVYRTQALIHVDEQNSAPSSIAEPTAAVPAGKTRVEAEIALIRSRSVLGATIAQQNLNIETQPIYFPVIGEALARRKTQSGGLAKPLFGLNDYAWGGEKIKVDRLDVPRGLLGQPLELIVGDNNSYAVTFNGEEFLTGTVGIAAQASGVSVYISEIKARPKTRFVLLRQDWFGAFEKLERALSIFEKGKQSGILELVLDGPEPQRLADTLNAIVFNYQRQNVERNTENAAKILAFVDGQLPELKKQLSAAETALNQFRMDNGTINLNLETRQLLGRNVKIKKAISSLDLRRTELSQGYTDEHPEILTLEQQRNELIAENTAIETRILRLPDAQQDSLRLISNVEIVNELYVLLLERAQELRVMRAGTIGNIRIIDQAFVPASAFRPKRRLLVMAGSGLGILFGFLFVFIRDSMNPAIRDPEKLEKAGGLPVYAIVPHSLAEKRLSARRDSKQAGKQLLVDAEPNDIAVESLRSLRTSLEFLLLDANPEIVTISGIAPGAGKSFVAANLAALFPQAGKKTLLIDADLRRGRLSKLWRVPRQPGLAEVISGSNTIDDAIQRVVTQGLDIITTGVLPNNPAELIASSRFEKLLVELAARYDIVVIDSPPVLAAAEAVTLARLAAVSLLVVRSEQQTQREISLTLRKLREGGVNPSGFVLNDFSATASLRGYGKYHHYDYQNSP